jgi:hypothetical protein
MRLSWREARIRSATPRCDREGRRRHSPGTALALPRCSPAPAWQSGRHRPRPRRRLRAAGGKADRVIRVELLTPPSALNQEQRQGITTDATRIIGELARTRRRSACGFSFARRWTAVGASAARPSPTRRSRPQCDRLQLPGDRASALLAETTPPGTLIGQKAVSFADASPFDEREQVLVHQVLVGLES